METLNILKIPDNAIVETSNGKRYSGKLFKELHEIRTRLMGKEDVFTKKELK